MARPTSANCYNLSLRRHLLRGEQVRREALARRPQEYLLQCACGAYDVVTVSDHARLYRLMNTLGWGLIPTHHGHRVKGVCPTCRQKEEAQL